MMISITLSQQQTIITDQQLFFDLWINNSKYAQSNNGHYNHGSYAKEHLVLKDPAGGKG